MAETAPRTIIQPYLDRFLDSRSYPKTICPSEVARALTRQELNELDLDTWRDAMPVIRTLLAAMRQRGEVEILQRGHVLEGELGDGLELVVGPIRARRGEDGLESIDR